MILNMLFVSIFGEVNDLFLFIYCLFAGFQNERSCHGDTTRSNEISYFIQEAE